MTKRLLLVSLVYFFLIGCETTNEDEYDFNGRSLGISHMENLVTVFVEDNFMGTEIGPFDQQSFNRDTYEVEAYRVLLTEDTRIILDETEEEIDMIIREDEALELTRYNDNIVSLFTGNGREISIKVEEPFSNETSSNRNDYILYDHQLLPIYTAEEVRIYPLQFQDFLYRFRHFGNQYTLIGIFESGSSDEQQFNMYYNDYLKEINDSGSGIQPIHFFTFDSGYFETFNPPEEYIHYPLFLILSDSSVEHFYEWEKAIKFLEDNNIVDN
ncbi:hypothetical protein QA612_02150 [Evansella sp. AB-P1]|uniref:hypothetical protein n=1 Tax=Evansella sp. AB-P1 TaxID=3037653 RepID=UPI00241C8E7C|nr:hypothetical protein [Evansella sp. AB-P1]MDG5786275.1 hypothetical protein [Evansella sp. AB-P1]